MMSKNISIFFVFLFCLVSVSALTITGMTSCKKLNTSSYGIVQCDNAASTAVAAPHTHSAANITSGTLAYARLPSLTNRLTLTATNITNAVCPAGKVVMNITGNQCITPPGATNLTFYLVKTSFSTFGQNRLTLTGFNITSGWSFGNYKILLKIQNISGLVSINNTLIAVNNSLTAFSKVDNWVNSTGDRMTGNLNMSNKGNITNAVQFLIGKNVAGAKLLTLSRTPGVDVSFFTPGGSIQNMVIGVNSNSGASTTAMQIFTGNGIIGGKQFNKSDVVIGVYNSSLQGLFSHRVSTTKTYIGIGNIEPMFQLDVFGNSRFNGTMNILGNQIIKGNLNVTSNVTARVYKFSNVRCIFLNASNNAMIINNNKTGITCP